MRKYDVVSPQYTNFSLDRMRVAVSAKTHAKPKNQTKEEFFSWMKSKRTTVTA